MNIYFWTSYGLLWLLLLPLVALNIVLFRQLGIVVMGTARGVQQTGIAIGRSVPSVTSTTINGHLWSSDSLRGQPHVLFFGSPTCKECKEIMPDLGRVHELFGVTPILLMFADNGQARSYAKQHQLTFDVVEMPAHMGAKLDVWVTPFAYGVDERGIVRAKGLVNTRTQLDAIAHAAASDRPGSISLPVIDSKEGELVYGQR